MKSLGHFGISQLPPNHVPAAGPWRAVDEAPGAAGCRDCPWENASSDARAHPGW